jgi:hypothetical protein
MERREVGSLTGNVVARRVEFRWSVTGTRQEVDRIRSCQYVELGGGGDETFQIVADPDPSPNGPLKLPERL